MTSTSLTENSIKNIPAPQDKTELFYDTALPGFGVKVSPHGVRTFFLRYRVKGRERQIKIGRFPDWSVLAARKEAQRLKVEADRGNDPLAEREKQRQAPLFRDIWADYEGGALPKKAPRSQKDERGMAALYILPALGHKRAEDITEVDIARLHRQITEQGKGVRANRVIEVVRSCFGNALKNKSVEHNPAVGFSRNHEEKRERYLSDDELRRVCAALDMDENQRICRFFRFLLLTGARSGETRLAKWEQMDFEAKIWSKPSAHTKQKKNHTVPLSEAAIELLWQIRRGTNSEYVFPQENNPEAPMTGYRHVWKRIMKMAQISDFRIHDLRHSYASIMVSNGISLPVIGKLLGHTQQQTTARYAHLSNAPLKEATNKAASLMGFHAGQI